MKVTTLLIAFATNPTNNILQCDVTKSAWSFRYMSFSCPLVCVLLNREVNDTQPNFQQILIY